MNPFSGFLQPQNNRPLDGMATTQDVLRVFQGNKEMAQRKLENDQQNTRANSYLAMQQGDQAHRFGAEEQKQVESLLAEYQDAEDQGDPVRLSRAAQQLKRFGMDLGQKQAPNLRALTGEQTLPSAGVPKNLGDFTGEAKMQNPIDAAVDTEMKSREALRARSAAPEQDLSQDDFEQQLINGDQAAPSRYESGGQTTEEFRKQLPQAPAEESTAPVDMGDVDSPEFKAAAAQEGTNGDVIDLDQEAGATPLQIGKPQQAQPVPQAAPLAQPRRLATQLLPTVISKNGKQLYESTGPSGRWAPMVSGVFDPYVQHENPTIAKAASSAQALAGKLISVDGISPKDAIEFASKRMEAEIAQANQLERTKIGSRPRVGLGGGGSGLMGKTQDIAESAQLYDDNARAEAAKIQEEDRQYESIESAANSGDPALQRDAVNQLLKIRSGSAVTASEDARISQINGLVAQVQDRMGRWTGGAMTPEMARTIQQIVALKRQVSQAKIKRIYEHQAKLYKVQNQGKTKDPAVLEERARVLQQGGDSASGPSEEDLY